MSSVFEGCIHRQLGNLKRLEEGLGLSRGLQAIAQGDAAQELGSIDGESVGKI